MLSARRTKKAVIYLRCKLILPSRDETTEIILVKNEVTEAVSRRYSVNNLFRNLAQNSLESTHYGVFVNLPSQVFSSEFYENVQNSYSKEHHCERVLQSLIWFAKGIIYLLSVYRIVKSYI